MRREYRVVDEVFWYKTNDVVDTLSDCSGKVDSVARDAICTQKE